MRRLTLLALVLAAVLGITAQKEAPLVINPADRTLIDNVLLDMENDHYGKTPTNQGKHKNALSRTAVLPSLDIPYFHVGLNRNTALPCYNPNGRCTSICCLIGRCLEYHCKCGCNPELNNEIMNTTDKRISFNHYVKNYISWRMCGSYTDISDRSDFSNNAYRLFDIGPNMKI